MKVAFVKTKSAVVLWDVDRIIRDIRVGKLMPKFRMMSVPDLREQCGYVNYDVSDCDLGNTPIVAHLAKEKYRVLVGEEQICKSGDLFIKNIRCFYLEPHEHKRYIVDYDKEVYCRAVEEYWDDTWYDEDDEEEEEE